MTGRDSGPILPDFDEPYACLEHDWVDENPCPDCTPLDSVAPRVLLKLDAGERVPTTDERAEEEASPKLDQG